MINYESGEYHIVYFRKNRINNMLYVGCHNKTEEFDNYKGSGSLLKEAINEYGNENFSFLPLLLTDDALQASLLERDIVNEEWVVKENTYNIALGGNTNLFPNHNFGGIVDIPKYPLFKRKRLSPMVYDKKLEFIKTTQSIRRKRKIIQNLMLSKTDTKVIICGLVFDNFQEASQRLETNVENLLEKLISPKFPEYRFLEDGY